MFQKSHWIHCVSLWTIILGLLCGSLYAQNTTGTLTGSVTDPSGAVIPGAAVVMKNQQSGDERRTVTNNDGFFSISGVQVGDYSVNIAAQGFEKYKQTNIHFDAGDTRALANIALKVGASTDTVTVTGEAEDLTPVDSGEKSIVISTKVMNDIAIQGQNAAEFIKILPGFALSGGNVNGGYNGQVQNTGAGPVGSFSANGLRTGALDITSDGAHTIDPGCNCGQAVNTTTDMTQEMKVLTSNFGADNAKGPVVIAAIGKSGGQQFHGEAYLYARTGIFDATNAFNNSEGTNPLTGQKVAPKPDTSFYYPGANIGGPVIIPGTRFNKNHDKLFFFLAYEYYKQQVQDLSHDVYNSIVPTTDMRNGIFTAASLQSYFGTTSPSQGYALGPATSNSNIWAGITNGVVPQSLFSTQGVNSFAKLFPMPNVNPLDNNGYNYITSTTHSDNMWQLRPRVDWSINENTKLFVSYNVQHDLNHDNGTVWWGTNPAVPYPSPLNQANYSNSLSVNLTKVFNPTLTNEAVFTYTELYVPFTLPNAANITQQALGIQFQHIFNTSINNQIPVYTGWSDGVANLIQPSGFETGSLYAHKWLPSFADNVSKVWGTHTAKFGFYWERTKNQQPSDSYTNGELQYANWGQGSTGNAYADMLVGAISGGYDESNGDPVIKMHYTSVAFFAQDSWKVNRRFTLDYGIRLDHLGPWDDESGNGAAVFNPAAYNANIVGGGETLTGFEWHKIDPSIPIGGTPGRLLFYDPRFGGAFDVFGTGKTVLRGGFGMYRYHDEQNVQAGAMALPQGAFTFGPQNPSNGQPQTFPYIATFAGNANYVVPSSITALDPKDTEQPLTTSYSFTVSQRMPWASTAEFSYVGNNAKDLSNNGSPVGNLNVLPYGTLFQPANIGLFGDQTTNTPTNTCTNCATTDNPGVNALHLYSLYGSIHEIEHNEYSNYNSFQASWNKQSGHFNYLMNYTFSKALGIRGENSSNGVGDPTNIANDYGVLPNDRTHLFNAAYSYQEGTLLHGNKFLGGFVNGWQVSGITQFQSGIPLQAQNSSNFGLSGQFPIGTVLPNGVNLCENAQNCQSLSNASITGSPDINMQPVLTCDPSKNLAKNQYINGSCFALPTVGHNGSFIFPYIKGPAFFDSDLSLFKNFQISESKKVQFRFSAYNFLNHPLASFNPAGGDGNLTLSFNSAGKLNNNTFGYAEYLNGNRSVQMTVKFFF
jgi:hypothetical protein